MKIIITGSEGLIGKEIGKYLAKKNKIIKVDLTLGHNLSDEKFVKKWFKENKADCLINCFALNDHVNKGRQKETLFNITLESFSKYMDINLTALFSVCREFARNNKKSSIVNFASAAALVSPRPDMYEGAHKHIAYSISKAGVINMTKFLATHLAPNIRVNCVAPGGIEFNQGKKFVKRYSKHTPMKRMMKKSELNGLMEFLCSDSSSYVTGATFVVDGGWTVW